MKRTGFSLLVSMLLTPLSSLTYADSGLDAINLEGVDLVPSVTVTPATSSKWLSSSRALAQTLATDTGIPDISDIDTLDIPYYDRLGFDGEATLNGSAFDYTVSNANGQLVMSQTDVSLAGNGLPIVVKRDYRSRTNLSADLRWSPLGFGWDMSFGRLKFQFYRMQAGGLCHQPSDDVRYILIFAPAIPAYTPSMAIIR